MSGTETLTKSGQKNHRKADKEPQKQLQSRSEYDKLTVTVNGKTRRKS